MICKFCKKEILSNNDNRFGCCFKCANIESIIIDNETMSGKKCETKEDKISMIKLMRPSVDAEYWYNFHKKRERKMKLKKIKN